MLCCRPGCPDTGDWKKPDAISTANLTALVWSRFGSIPFYDDGRVSREQAADKFLKIPAEVPRFWLAAEAAKSLRQRLLHGEEIQVRLCGRMDWERVPGYNIYAYLPGADEPIPGTPEKRWKDRVIVLSASCDAMSVVPALAPGAEEERLRHCCTAALLHLAEFMAAHRPKYSLLFLATSAHFEGLAGVNDFRPLLPEPFEFSLFIGLDLSSHNDQVAAFSEGTFYNGWGTNDYLKNMMAPYARRATASPFFRKRAEGPGMSMPSHPPNKAGRTICPWGWLWKARSRSSSA